MTAAASSLPPATMFNATGRGYPDVAALAGEGNPYCIGAGSMMVGIAGTSAACPVTAAIFARLNAVRLASGGNPLGFLNPWIYNNQEAFNDVTQGCNTGGGSHGAPQRGRPARGAGSRSASPAARPSSSRRRTPSWRRRTGGAATPPRREAPAPCRLLRRAARPEGRRGGHRRRPW